MASCDVVGGTISGLQHETLLLLLAACDSMIWHPRKGRHNSSGGIYASHNIP